MKSIKINQSSILKTLGFESLNKMQKATQVATHKNNNVILLAPTGSGKTLAYLLSILSKLKQKNEVQALIIAPTRELVLQIESVLKQMKLDLKVNSCYGGHPFSIERKNFSVPPSILVGTPGRIKDHIERATFDTSSITQLVFDEFDKSLEFGFTNELKFITKQLDNVQHKILVSATKTIELPDYLDFDNPYTIEFEEKEKASLSIQKIIVPKDEKLEGLIAVLNNLKKGQNAIVFSNHRDACDRISEQLDNRGIIYALFHGGLEQKQREFELTKFRNGSVQVLVATDIAARGIDIPDLDYVIHYQIPYKEDSFIHRNGRTARMKASGTSILILTEEDYVPEYLDEDPSLFDLKENARIGKPDYITLHINKGKKDKISKFDLVGYFLQFDFMKKDDLGLMEVNDFDSFIAIKREKANLTIKASQGKKLKKKSPKISIA